MITLSPLINYPSLANVEKLPEMFAAIQKAAVPSKFTYRYFAKLGFTSSNDRGFVPLLEFLGFIDEDSRPTVHYLRMRDKNDFPVVLAQLFKESYNDVFAINPNILKAPKDEVINIFNRLTGKDEKDVLQSVLTFESTSNLAQISKDMSGTASEYVSNDQSSSDSPHASSTPSKFSLQKALTLNITLNLPNSTDSAVYDAIFRSIKENLQ